jgi:hypothetical protein
MIYLPVLLLAAAQTSTAPAPAAVSEQTRFDVRCMLASQMAADGAEGAEKVGLTLATMFYFGRVDAVLSGDPVTQQMELAGKGLEGKPLQPVLKECGEFMMRRGEAMQNVAGILEAREKARELR